MIEGVVNSSYEAIVALSLRGPDGDARDIEAVIDTGYNGFLTLPPRLVAELRLPFVTSAQAILANGSEETFDVHSVTVLWDSHPVAVDAYASDTTPLVGMRLLDQCDVYVQVRDGGRVLIETSN